MSGKGIKKGIRKYVLHLNNLDYLSSIAANPPQKPDESVISWQYTKQIMTVFPS